MLTSTRLRNAPTRTYDRAHAARRNDRAQRKAKDGKSLHGIADEAETAGTVGMAGIQAQVELLIAEEANAAKRDRGTCESQNEKNTTSKVRSGDQSKRSATT